MKKSKLKKYVRENIISTLSENTEDEIAKTKELTQAVQDLESAKKEAGIKEANVGLAEIEEMGYNNGEDAFERIKGRFKNRIDHLAYRKGFFQGFTDSASSYGLNENEDEDVVKYKGEDHVITRRDGDRIYLRRKEDSAILGRMPEFWVKSQDINENEDAEPTKSDIKKTKGLAKAKEELALLTREMKSLAKKYSKAEGADKEKLVKILKDKTKLKRELENILDKKKI